MRILKYFIAISVIVVASSCEDYLDTDNIYGKSLETYYSSPTDINEAIAGVYNALYTVNVLSDESIAANLMSDMMLGGGGPDDVTAKWIDNFEDPNEDTYRDLWVQSYNGIARTNAIIEKTVEADFTSFYPSEAEAQQFKDQAIGEAYFMRAFYYFRLAKFFGGVPLILAIEDPKDAPRASYSETFAQIASDLKMAIETLPDTPFTSIPTSEYGHANKWVAQAYMGRVYLFYTGYMTNMNDSPTSDLPLVDGGTVSASDVTAYLDDVINNSGHALASDFRSLWPYSHVNEAAGDTIIPWVAEEELSWVGQDGHTPRFGSGNLETMFVQRFSFGDWDWQDGNIYTNRLSLFSSVRGGPLVGFGEGWGWLTVNPRLWNNWEDTDTRKVGSILEMGNPDQGTGGYEPGKGDHETGYLNKKYKSLEYPDDEGTVKGMFVQLYDWGNADMQLMHAQDFIYMRYADVLLMHSEITGTDTGMNAVRERAGLPAIGYSLEALKQERLHEFAFEGLRWFDLVRWGDVESAFDYTLNVNNSGTAATYEANYRPETKGLVPIPETEMRLSNGVYEQNPGW